jgi:hypothetical protein
MQEKGIVCYLVFLERLGKTKCGQIQANTIKKTKQNKNKGLQIYRDGEEDVFFWP